ncbi:MAG: YiiG family protein [Oscillospiraceae bacterium]|nr:YiiG family protein [Oscillospiraceae bacterium]
MKMKIIAIFLVLSLSLSACATSGGRLSEEAALTEKYNAYIELLNFCTGRWFYGVVSSYFSTFGYDYEPNEVDKDFTNGFIFSSDVDNPPDLMEMYSYHYETPRRLADESPSFGEADEAAHRLADALEALMNIYFVTINDYYSSGEYIDDNYAKTGEYHVEMLMNYIEFLDATDYFAVVFSDVILEYEGQDLEVFKERGWDIHYYMLSIILTSRKISNMFQKLDLQGIDFLDADISEYEPLYEQLISDIAELILIFNDDGKHRTENLSGMQINRLSFFVSTAQTLETAASDTLNMIIAGTEDIPNELTGHLTTGGRNLPMYRFNQRLDSLIDYYNQIIS